jgi:putative methionine-R-sulfoxide reductase with GAF domain
VTGMLDKMMAERLYAQQTFEGAIATLLHDVVALHGAEFGDVQLRLGDELVIVAQQGLGAAFLTAFKRVGCDDGSACGRALRERKTIVIEDVEADAEYEQFRSEARVAGYRAVQTTPLFTSNGELIGMVSTLFANVHRPTTIEMDSLRSYSVCAADYLQSLLKNADLALKAAEMHSALCTMLDLDNPDHEIEVLAPDLCLRDEPKARKPGEQLS